MAPETPRRDGSLGSAGEAVDFHLTGPEPNQLRDRVRRFACLPPVVEQIGMVLAIRARGDVGTKP